MTEISVDVVGAETEVVDLEDATAKNPVEVGSSWLCFLLVLAANQLVISLEI